jgi:peptidoglycan hydrolase CwlO-like protein
MEDFQSWIYGIASTIVAAVVGYFSGKRKNEAETESVIISNYDSLIAQYATFKQNLLEEVDRLNSLITKQNDIITQQTQVIKEASEQIEKLEKEIKTLKENQIAIKKTIEDEPE